MDMIRWPYQADMLMRQADGSDRIVRVQWMFASPAAKPLKYLHRYGSSNYFKDHGYDLPGPGEKPESYRRNNPHALTADAFDPTPCPDLAEQWNPK